MPTILQAIDKDPFIQGCCHGGAIPILGALPSSVAVIYGSAQTIRYLAQTIFCGLSSYLSKNPDGNKQRAFSDAKENLACYSVSTLLNVVNVFTLGLTFTTLAFSIAYNSVRNMQFDSDD